MLSFFSQVAEALMGLIYHRPSGENFSSAEGYSIDMMLRNVAEKHYDSRHDKLRNNMDTTESTNTNIFNIIMCWYELMVHFFGYSTCMIEWRSSWGVGVLCLCFQAQSPLPEKPGLYLLLGGEASLQMPELPFPPKETNCRCFLPS